MHCNGTMFMLSVILQGNVVAYDEGHPVQLERKLFLEDAISDLPEVCNSLLLVLPICIW